MFFGYTVILIGMDILLRSISILVIFIPAFIVFEFIWIKLEERNLIKKFDHEFANYQKSTNFLIPNHLF
jgi:protein-S-isoprenylcysteine O-methyltransferase Ste14